MALNLSRDAKLYAAIAGTAVNGTGNTHLNMWELPVLDGFSFTQDSGTQDITVSEAGETPTRGMKQFTTTLNPVDVSFSMYVKPYIKTDLAVATKARASSVEHILWNALVSPLLGVGDAATSDVATSGIITAIDEAFPDINSASSTIDFLNSDVHELLLLDLYFSFENTTYKISSFSANSVEVDFSIDGIATLNWSGQGLTLEDDDTAHTEISTWVTGDRYTSYYPAPPGTAGCIKNRFTTMLIQDMNPDSDAYEDFYVIPITGGSITIDNGITYLTPEELGKVNTACGSFTGTRSITGNVTAYLNTGVAEGETIIDAKSTAQLLNDVLGLTDATNTTYAVSLYMGGKSDATPIVTFSMPTAHLVIPTINTEDVIATEISFVAQGSTGNLSDKDELTITYNQDKDNKVPEG